MSIIVVESETTEHSTIEEMLKYGGCQHIFTVSSVTEAMSLLGLNEGSELAIAHSGVDLIILDCAFHPQNFELIRQFKDNLHYRDVPVLVIAESGMMGNLQMAFAFGANDYLTHPIIEQELIARVRASLMLKHEIDRRKAREKELIEASRQLADLNAWLTRVSLIDSLTKVSNRRAFDTALEQEWRRAVRHQTSVALLMLDVDHFKAYNDQYGHPAGDACLTQVAQTVKSTLQRPGDTTARYGGEEFAVILAETDGQGAACVAERIRANVEALAIPHAQSSTGPYVTVSLGVAALEATQERQCEELITQADAALYEAKGKGRNGVVTWQSQPSPARVGLSMGTP